MTSYRDEYFDPHAIRRHAEEFDTQRFLRRFSQFVETKVASHPVLSRRAGFDLRGPVPPLPSMPSDFAMPDDPTEVRRNPYSGLQHGSIDA